MIIIRVKDIYIYMKLRNNVGRRKNVKSTTWSNKTFDIKLWASISFKNKL